MINIKKFKSIFAVMAVVLAFSSVTAFASDDEDTEPKTIRTVQGLFNEKRSLGKHIVQQIKDGTKTIYFEAKEFAVYLAPTDMGYLEKGPERYNLDVVYDREQNKNVEKKLLEKTPYNIIDISDKDGLPGMVTYTLKDTSFKPLSTVHLYELTDNDKKTELVMNDITVSSNCDITFSIQNSGRYLITTKHPGVTANPYAFDKPALVNFDDLITK